MESHNERPLTACQFQAVKFGVGGLFLVAVAALIGIPDLSAGAEATVTPARVILTVLGMIVAGGAITMRPRWAPVWLLGAGAGLLATVGFPSSWDSFRLVAGVFGALALLARCSPPCR